MLDYQNLEELDYQSDINNIIAMVTDYITDSRIVRLYDLVKFVKG